MKGYKVFNPDWTCRGFQFEVGQIFEEDVEPKCCESGFHFCTKASDCFKYYDFNPENKVAEVEALGDVVTDSDNTKSCTNKIHIVREITWHEVLELVNLGKGCTGLWNSGNYNSGNYNSGDWNSGNCNSGNCNSGNYNSGDWNSGNWNSGNYNSGNYNSGNCNSGNYNSGNYNSGNYNSGNCNSGNYNSGDWNSGNCNSGNCNSGNCNSGNCNSGNYNSGDWNSGNWNSGNYNSGNYNSGNYNSGDWNSGNWNSGNCNSGNYNSGDWNNTSFSNGCFNTKAPKIFLFNKLSNWTYKDWLDSNARFILMGVPSDCLEFVWSDDMTNEEKEMHPEHQATGGFLKCIGKEDGRQKWWDGLSDKDKKTIMDIPNFDKDVFKKVTGIEMG